MPWHVSRSDSCPESRPWAVIKDSDGSVEGCHASESDAKNQMAALYAQESLDPAGHKMQHKSFDILEAKADGESGTFEALVSVFGNVDSMGDRIQPGAFKNTLAKWSKSGDPIPVILSHDWQNPWSHIGVVNPGDAKETDRGLMVKGHLDVKDNEVARQVHRLMSRRSLKEFSFGYHVVKEKRGKDGANELQDLDLIEVGPTLKGANPATELHAVKSAIEEENQPPPTKAEVKREMDRLRAEEVTGEIVPTEPSPDQVEQLTETVQALAGSVTELKGQVDKALEEPPPPPKSEDQIRQELVKHRAAEETKDVPKGEPSPTPFETLSQQVETLTAAVAEMGTSLDEKLKALASAVEEPKRANSADMQRFRKEATQAVVEVDSDGVSFSKPPAPDPEPEREPEWALKARARREITQLLTD